MKTYDKNTNVNPIGLREGKNSRSAIRVCVVDREGHLDLTAQLSLDLHNSLGIRVCPQGSSDVRLDGG